MARRPLRVGQDRRKPIATPHPTTEGKGHDRAKDMIGQTAAKMRAHLDQFSGRLSAGLSKPARRFVAQALYGIAARGSVRLSEIGRALEETVPLAKTETRLSRNLGRRALRDHLGGAVLGEGSARIGKRTLLVLDLSDIAKPCARKMKYLAGCATAAAASSLTAIGCAR